MREISVKEVKKPADKKQPPAWLIEAGKKVNKVSIDIDAPIINMHNDKDEEDEVDKRK